MDKNKLQQLINQHIDPYSPDVSEVDHLYNQGKAEGIKIGFDAAESIANAKITELEQQLKKADEVMRSMYIDTMAWNIKTTDREVLSGWHESNNEAIEKYLKSRGE